MSRFFTQPDDFAMDEAASVDPTSGSLTEPPPWDDLPTHVTATPVDSRDRAELAVLSIEPGIDLAQVQTAITLIDSMKRWVAEQDKNLKERLISYIQQNGEFMIGDERFSVGHSKTVKCEDVTATARVLLGFAEELVNPATGEVVDLAALLDCLSSSAFKPAATMKRLTPEHASRLFKTETKPTLEVQRINTKFVK